MKLTQFDVSLAVYTCKPKCKRIGFINDTFVIKDTHRIGSELSGNGNGFLKLARRRKDHESRKSGNMAVVKWLKCRMGDKKEGIGSESLLHFVIEET